MLDKEVIRLEGENPLKNIIVRSDLQGRNHAEEFCGEVKQQIGTNRSRWQLGEIENIASDAASEFLGTGWKTKVPRAVLGSLAARMPEMVLNRERQGQIERFFDQNPPPDLSLAQDPLQEILSHQAKVTGSFSEKSLLPYAIAMHDVRADLIQNLSGKPAPTARAAVNQYNHTVSTTLARKMRDVIAIIEEKHATPLRVARPPLRLLGCQSAISEVLLGKIFLSIGPQISGLIAKSDPSLPSGDQSTRELKRQMQVTDGHFCEIRQAFAGLLVGAIEHVPDQVTRNIQLLVEHNSSYRDAMQAEAELGDRLTGSGAKALLAVAVTGLADSGPAPAQVDLV